MFEAAAAAAVVMGVEADTVVVAMSSAAVQAKLFGIGVADTTLDSVYVVVAAVAVVGALVGCVAVCGECPLQDRRRIHEWPLRVDSSGTITPSRMAVIGASCSFPRVSAKVA